MWDGFNARKKAEKRPTIFPPMSFPKKNAIRIARVPKIAGKSMQKSYSEIGTPSTESMVYEAAAVRGRPGNAFSAMLIVYPRGYQR